MKLQEILNKLQGTEFEGLIQDINKSVDVIKAKAIATTKAELKSSSDAKVLEEALIEKEDIINKLQEELAPLKAKAKYESDFKSFIEKGGKEDIDLSDFNYQKYTNKKGEIEWESFFEKHPSLKQETKQKVQEDATLMGNTTVSAEQLVKEEMEMYEKESRLNNV